MKTHVRDSSDVDILSVETRVDDSIDMDSNSVQCFWAVVDKQDLTRKNFGVFFEEQSAIDRIEEVGASDLRVVEVWKGIGYAMSERRTRKVPVKNK